MTFDEVPLKRLVDPARPITYGIVQAGPDIPDGVPYIRPADMTESHGVSDLTRLLKTSHAIAGAYRRSMITTGDIVVSIGPSFGKVMVVPSALSGANLTQGTARIAPAAGVSPRFLYWALQSERSRSFWSSCVGGATFRALNLEPLSRTPIPLVPLQEQRRIADFLDAETARIDKLARATAYQEELVGERFLEWVRTQTTSGLGESLEPTGIPWMPFMARSWTLYKIGRAFRTGSGTTPKSSNDDYFGAGTPWLNTGDLTDGPVGEIKRSVTAQALRDYSALRIFDPGSLVIAMYGATIGRLGILEEPACTNQACCVLYDATSVDVRFAFYWLLAHREYITTLASGGGQPNISQDLVRSLRIPAPSLHQQHGIVSTIESGEAQVKRQRQLLARRRELLAEWRQALITAAVTGQFDVATGRGVDLS